MLYVKEVKEGSIVVNEEYAYCPTHEEKHKELMIDNVAIPEEEFKRLDLTRTYFDPLETCKHCGRQWHTACAMEYSEKFCTDFVCPTCRHGGFGIDVKIGPFARQLPENALSKHIERHIREVLKEQKKSASSVFIRVLSSEKMEYEIDEIVQKAYNCSSKTIGYWSRVIFAFQVVDAQEVAIFGLRVQEFGEDAPEAMRQLVNISYLDSVRVVDSKEHRIKIFQEIVLSYMMYAAQNGFKKLHIWSRPPSFGEDYIFFSHPITQLYPDQRSLDNWYCTIFEGAKTKKIVESYEKLKEVDSVTKIPLCEDGFIMSMMQEDKYADIEEVLENVNLKLKVNTLYIITLTNPEHLVLDTDLPVRSELFARQPTFLLKARKEKWYFSSLQEAKYSTFCFIREMSQNDREKKSNQLENTDWFSWVSFIFSSNNELVPFQITTPSVLFQFLLLLRHKIAHQSPRLLATHTLSLLHSRLSVQSWDPHDRHWNPVIVQPTPSPLYSAKLPILRLSKIFSMYITLVFVIACDFNFPFKLFDINFPADPSCDGYSLFFSHSSIWPVISLADYRSRVPNIVYSSASLTSQLSLRKISVVLSLFRNCTYVLSSVVHSYWFLTLYRSIWERKND